MNPRRKRSSGVVLATVALLAVAGCSSPQAEKAERPTQGRPTAAVRPPDVVPLGPAADVLLPQGGLFDQNSVWKADVSSMPVADTSPGQISGLTSVMSKLYGGTAAFNLYHYGLSWFTVSAGQAPVTVGFSNCQNKPATPPGLYGSGGQFVDVPIPDDAVPTPGRDGELTIYQPSTDTLWDFWKAFKDAQGWHACWGGRIDNVSQGTGAFEGYYGASASGLAREAGAISIRDVRAGKIDHAIALALPFSTVSRDHVWPARRSDGHSVATSAIPEGARLRLDPSIDVDSLGLSPIATMVAKAAQTYGFIVADKAGTTAVAAEGPYAYESLTGVDPWKDLLGGIEPYQILKGFPWDKVQVLKTGTPVGAA